MELLVEVKVEDDLPVNETWEVPNLSAVVLLPVVHLFRNPDMEFAWTEENVFRAYRNDDGEIKLEFPMGTKDFNLLAFCVARVIDSMVSALLETDWEMEYLRRRFGKPEGILKPQMQMQGPLRL